MPHPAMGQGMLTPLPAEPAATLVSMLPPSYPTRPEKSLDCVECGPPSIGGAQGRGENARVGHDMASTTPGKRPTGLFPSIIDRSHGQGTFTSAHKCENFVT
jgi:hypothetical protein